MNLTSAARVIVGYDGSLPANAAIDAGAALVPHAHAWITHLWTPPFASDALRRRLWHGRAALNEFVDAIEREGKWEAGRIAATGVTLARAAGWEAEALVERSYGGEGLQFTELTEKLQPDLVLLGSRGLGGARAILGSVSDMVVHYTPRPVLVTPYPLLSAEYAALDRGPVVVGWDGSDGSRQALAEVDRLFPTRDRVLVEVDDGGPGAPAPPGRDVVTVPAERRHGETARGVAAALAAVARERQAALLAVGSRGRTAVQELLLGSVAMASLHHAYRAILVVPRHAADS